MRRRVSRWPRYEPQDVFLGVVLSSYLLRNQRPPERRYDALELEVGLQRAYLAEMVVFVPYERRSRGGSEQGREILWS